MATFKFCSKPVCILGKWVIRSKTKKRVKFMGIHFWKTMETRYYGPYKSYMDAYIAAEEDIEFSA